MTDTKRKAHIASGKLNDRAVLRLARNMLKGIPRKKAKTNRQKPTVSVFTKQERQFLISNRYIPQENGSN